MKYRELKTVLFEAVIIGLFTALLYYIINYIYNKLKFDIGLYGKIFIVGFFAHLLFEYIGMNEKWCRDVYQL